ncbi:MAG: hypothetical protein IPN34_09030 [Planctomycetes bacterium]|nr:hypothetical protein [Planctomycetota bacterium]
MLRSCVRSLARSGAALLPLALLACAGAPTIEGRVIQRAEVDPVAVPTTRPGDPLASAVRLLSAGHLLRSGDGSVLQLYRQRVDEESGQRALELLTIGLPAKYPRGRLDLRDKKLSATYSYSSGDDALEAHGRSSSMEGFVTVQSRGSGVLVELEADALLAGGVRRRLSWNAQIPGTSVHDFRAWPTATWSAGFWFLEREAPTPAATSR